MRSKSTSSISCKVVVLPRLKRMASIPMLGEILIAFRTGDNSTEPEWQAAPVEAADALLIDCANKVGSFPDTAIINGLKAKLFASEMAVNVTNLAIQVMGGHGYCRDYVVERLFRDARGLMLHFKTSEWLRQDIAKAVTGM